MVRGQSRPCKRSSRYPDGIQNPEEIVTNLACSSGMVMDGVNNRKPKEVIVNKGHETFKINLNVGQFKSEELTVKVIENRTIKIEGKHDEREEDGGTVERHFIRKFEVPEVYDLSRMKFKLSPEGELEIVVPVIGENRTEDVEIPVIKENN